MKVGFAVKPLIVAICSASCGPGCSSDERAIAFCHRLKDKDGVSATCHAVVDPDLFGLYDECVFNYCKSAAMACASFQIYEDWCADEGVEVSPSPVSMDGDGACDEVHPES